MGRRDREKRRQNRQRRRNKKKTEPKITPPSPPVVVPKEEPKMLDPKGTDNAVPKQNKGEQPKPKRRAIKIQDWFAFALVLFTFGQCVVGYLQWDATHKQWKEMLAANEITKGQLDLAAKQLDMMYAEQRAWLTVSDPTMDWHRAANGARRPIIRYKITNSGKTYAPIDSNSIAITVKIREPTDPAFIGYKSITPAIGDGIAPGITKACAVSIDVQDDSFHDAVLAGKVALYLQGTIVYSRTSSHTHHTDCDYWYDYSNDTFHDQGGHMH